MNAYHFLAAPPVLVDKATRITLDTNDPWWVYAIQALTAAAALAAVGIAVYGIVQSRRLEADRAKAARRQRLQAKLNLLDEAAERLTRLEGYAKNTDTLNAAREQQRLRVIALRARSERSHDIGLIVKFDFTGAVGQREELLRMCGGVLDKVIWEVGMLVADIDDSLGDAAIKDVKQSS